MHDQLNSVAKKVSETDLQNTADAVTYEYPSEEWIALHPSMQPVRVALQQRGAP
jgi:hypothetical protein